ncbi:MAG: TlpA family protein disulfide reductase [Myxococcaceae bacterium]
MSAASGKGGLLNQLVIGLLVVGLIGAAVYQGVQEAKQLERLSEGNPAPAFSLEKFGGGTLSLEEQRGKVVMLDFWATWCKPCVVEMPSLVKLAGEFEGRGLVFVAANSDDESEQKAAVGIFVDQAVPGLGRHVVFADGPVSGDYGVETLPTLFLIDREGKIIRSARGMVSESELRGWLEEAVLARAP